MKNLLLALFFNFQFFNFLLSFWSLKNRSQFLHKLTWIPLPTSSWLFVRLLWWFFTMSFIYNGLCAVILKMQFCPNLILYFPLCSKTYLLTFPSLENMLFISCVKRRVLVKANNISVTLSIETKIDIFYKKRDVKSSLVWIVQSRLNIFKLLGA